MALERRAELLSLWQNIEKTQLSELSGREYAERWGVLREAFYSDHGGIPLDPSDADRLRTLHNKYAGRRIFVIGNGPSLNRTPLELLADEFTFATNRFYLMFDKIKWRPTFYTATDWRVVPDVREEINILSGMVFFFEERFRGLLTDDSRLSHTYWYTHAGARKGDDPRFAFDISKGVRGAGSVTGSAIQLARFMGFDPIYLIGCDQNYVVLPTVEQEGQDAFGNGVKLFLTSTRDDDPNHFDPRYFGTGRKWHDPNMPRMIAGFEQCRSAIEESGKSIFNATVGGQLEVFKRVDFGTLFPRPAGVPGRTDPSAFDLLLDAPEDRSLRNGAAVVAREAPAGSNSLGEFAAPDRAHVDEMEAVAALLDENKGVLVDVGAHRGSSLVHFARRKWKTYAFEPDDKNRSILQKVVQKEKFSVVVDQRAVGNLDGQMRAFYTSSESSGISSLHPITSGHQASQQVETVTLDRAIEQYGIEKIDVLKIDVEGNEIFALEGFSFQPTPRVIVVEYEDSKSVPLGYEVKNLAEVLIARGYDVFVSEWHPIVRYGVRHSWRRLYEWNRFAVPGDSWGNLIALRREAPHDLAQAFARVLTFPDSARVPAKPVVAAAAPVSVPSSEPPAAARAPRSLGEWLGGAERRWWRPHISGISFFFAAFVVLTAALIIGPPFVGLLIAGSLVLAGLAVEKSFGRLRKSVAELQFRTTSFPTVSALNKVRKQAESHEETIAAMNRDLADIRKELETSRQRLSDLGIDPAGSPASEKADLASR
jgi:FkbM family methyltransferase